MMRSSSRVSYARIPAPPAATRFDAIFVGAVTDLSKLLQAAAATPTPSDADAAT